MPIERALNRLKIKSGSDGCPRRASTSPTIAALMHIQ